jgi:hypothetical protein
MSLKARIRGLEAKVEWLERWGELRKVDRALKYRQSVKKIVDYLTANPKAAERLGVGDLVRAQPGHLDLADAIARARAQAAAADAAAYAAERATTGPPKPSPPEPPPPDSPSEKPPSALPPKVEAWTHDPPEHLQIEKVTWRMRGPQDELDDEEEEDGYYDPFSRG